MPASVAIERALQSIERAAFDPREWQRTVNLLAETFQSTLFAIRTFGAPVQSYLVSDGGGEVASSYFDGGWSERDLRAHRFAHAPARRVLEDLDLVSADEFYEAEFYRSFANDFGLTHLLSWRVDVGDHSLAFASNRSRAQGPMSAEERAAFEHLVTPASASAIAASHVTNARNAAFLEALTGSGAAAILLGAKGSVLAVTPAAEKLFAPEFKVRNRSLEIAGHTPDGALQSLYKAIEAPQGANPRLEPFTICTSAGKRIVCLPLLLQGPGCDLFSCARALLILRWVDRALAPDRGVLIKLFKLTPAQAEVVSLLAQGRTPTEVALRRQVSIQTVRSMLKAAFAKTATRSQAELVALVLRATTGIAN